MPKKETYFKERLPGLKSIANEWISETFDNKHKKSHRPPITKTVDNYEFQGDIAKDEMKIICMMRDKRTGRSIAMAKLKPEHRSPSDISQFLKEALTLAKLEHPNIVPVYEIAYDDDDIPFFTMKLLKGEALSTILKKIKSGNSKYTKLYTREKLFEIFIKVCDAVDFAHSESVIHLNLSPENIYVGDFGEVHVMHWKSSTSEDNPHKPETKSHKASLFVPLQTDQSQCIPINGTPGYMSPEQAGITNGKSNKTETTLTEASDIFSLGAILFSILSQERPFKGSTIEETLKKTRECTPPAFPKITDEEPISLALQAITKRAMALDAKMRHQSTRALRDELQSHLHRTIEKEENSKSTTQNQDTHIIRFLALTALAIAAITACTFLLLNYQKENKNAQKDDVSINTKTIIKAPEKTLNHPPIKGVEPETTISDIAEKVRGLRSKLSFKEAIATCDKLLNQGHDHPAIWMQKAKLHAGELEFSKAINSLKIIPLRDYSKIISIEDYKRFMESSKTFHSISQKRPITDKDALEYANALNDESILNQVIFNINNNPTTTLIDKIHLLTRHMLSSNWDLEEKDFHIDYNNENKELSIDLSNNPKLFNIRPIIGLPIKRLNISNCPNLDIRNCYYFIKQQVSVLNISGMVMKLQDPQLTDINYTKLIARDMTIHTAEVSYMSYLDIAGSTLIFQNLIPNHNLEYLNIAYTNYKGFQSLSEFPNLKTFIIDESMNIPVIFKQRFDKNSVKIIVIEDQSN